MALIHDDAQSTASTASTGNTTKCAKTCLQLSAVGLVAGVLDAADLRLGAGLVAGFTTIGVAGFTTSGSALSANFFGGWPVSRLACIGGWHVFRFGLFAPRAQHHCGNETNRPIRACLRSNRHSKSQPGSQLFQGTARFGTSVPSTSFVHLKEGRSLNAVRTKCVYLFGSET